MDVEKKFLGTEYGGWEISINDLDDGDTVIDAGLGEDISFLEELIKYKNINIIGIDPTEKSHKYVESKNLTNLKLIKKAIAPIGHENVKIYKNSNPLHVSESYYPQHQSVNKNFYEVESVSFADLIEKYKPNLIKMDVEGAEYDVLVECLGVKQICVEFHHHCIPNKTLKDSKDIINIFLENGYEIISNRNDVEYTLLKREKKIT